MGFAKEREPRGLDDRATGVQTPFGRSAKWSVDLVHNLA